MRAEDDELGAGEGANDPNVPREPSDPTEELRRRIYDLRTQGMSFVKIGALVNRSDTAVRKHYKAARLERMREIETDGWKPRVGDSIRKNERLYELCLLHFQHLTTQKDEAPVLDANGKVVSKGKKGGLGSVAAAIWAQTLLKVEKQGLELLMDVGVIPRAREKLDITITDARSMSLEELQAEAFRLKSQLAKGEIVADTLKAIPYDVSVAHEDRKKAQIIDAKVVKAVDKAVDEIEKLDP